jgi:hypothetical protein
MIGALVPAKSSPESAGQMMGRAEEHHRAEDHRGGGSRDASRKLKSRQMPGHDKYLGKYLSENFSHGLKTRNRHESSARSVSLL